MFFIPMVKSYEPVKINIIPFLLYKSKCLVFVQIIGSYVFTAWSFSLIPKWFPCSFVSRNRSPLEFGVGVRIQRGRGAHSVRSLISTCVAPSNRREKGGEKIHTLECQGKRGICASIRIGRGGGPGCVRGGDIFLLLPWKKRALVRPASLLCLGGKTLPVLCSTHCRRVR